MIKQYVFGPVASRRLGISLGVDLVRPKTCSLNCIYCEAKETTDLTLERKEYVPIDAVIAELDEVLRTKPELDYITFSGSGEPTLNFGIGRVVSFLKEKYPEYRICLLTNGFALGDRQLRSEIEPVDLIVPSLDASNAEEFEVINRPHPDLKFDGFIRDLTDFCRTTKSLVHLELFIVPGVNDSDESIARFVELIRPMRVPLVQLNTLDRPGVVDWIRPSTAGNTRRFIAALEPFVPVEAVGPFRYRTQTIAHDPSLFTGAEKRILDLVSRRPATVADLEVALNRPGSEINPILEKLFKSGLVEIEKQQRGTFYSAPHYKK